MFELFLRKKSIADFAKEDMQASKVLIAVVIAEIILQIIILILLATGIIESEKSLITLIIESLIIGVITLSIFTIIATSIGTILEYFCAKIVKGTTKFSQYFLKTLYLFSPFIILTGLTSIVTNNFADTLFASIAGLIALIFWIYFLYLKFGLIKNQFSLSTGNALFVLIVPVVLVIIIVIVLAAIFGGLFYEPNLSANVINTMAYETINI